MLYDDYDRVEIVNLQSDQALPAHRCPNKLYHAKGAALLSGKYAAIGGCTQLLIAPLENGKAIDLTMGDALDVTSLAYAAGPNLALVGVRGKGTANERAASELRLYAFD